MRQIPTLDLADAERLAHAARAAAAAMGVPQNVAVTDAAGALLLFLRMDDAKLTSAEIAVSKAFTAAGARCATADIAARTVPGEPGWMVQTQHGGRFTTLGGGVPVVRDSVTVGAIGVSGGSVAQDIEVAQAAVEAFAEG